MTISLVQSVQGPGSTSPLTLTLPNPTTPGNCLVACIGSQANTTNASISGVTLGGSVDNFASLLSAGTGAHEAILGVWADPNCAGGQTSVATAFSGGTGALQLFAAAYEFSGLASTIAGLLDKSSSVDASSSSTSWSSGTTATTSQASQAWVGLVATDGVTITGPASPWVNGTQLTGTGGTFVGDFMSGYQIRSATGAAAYAGTFSPSQFSVSAVVALNAAAAPAATPRPTRAVQAVKRAAYY